MGRPGPSVTGARAEMAVAATLHRAGWEVYLPLFGAHGRVYLVGDPGSGPLRIQVKAARLVAGCIEFHTCSNTGNVSADYRGEIDVFGVHSTELDAVFVVPIGDVAARKGFLRVDAPRNGQQRKIRWAEPYRVRPSGS